MPWNTVRIAMSADPTSPGTDSYPRESARTQRYTLGEPRDVVGLAGRGAHRVPPQPRRHRSGQLPVGRRRGERRRAPRRRSRGAARRARATRTSRPRRRPGASGPARGAGGITTFATDRDVRVTAFAIAGRLFVGGPRVRPGPRAPGRRPGVRPPSRSARPARRLRQRPAAVHRRARRLVARAGRRRGRRAGVDHVGQRRLHRRRGDGPLPRLLVEPRRHPRSPSTRVDTAPVQRWHLGDPADPATEPRELPYPAAGTPNAEVTLHVIALDGSIVDVEWDRDAAPVPRRRALVRRRPHRHRAVARPDERWHVLRVDPDTGATDVAFEDHDDVWVELVAGVPGLLPDGTVVTCADRDGARRLARRRRAGRRRPTCRCAPSPPIAAEGITFTANAIDDATSVQVWQRDARRHARAPSPTSPACTASPPVAARSSCARRRSPSPARSGRRSTASSSPATPPCRTLRADVHVLVRRRVTHRHRRPAPPRPRRLAAPGAARPLRRTPRPPRRAGPQRPPGVAVVRRPRVRGRRRRRAGHARARVGVGARRPPRPRHAGARRPDHRAAPRRRAAPARPDPRRHPRLELRRLPRRAGRAAPSRRVPRRRRRCPGHRVAPLRHPLHRALPRRSRTTSPRSTTPTRCCRWPAS